MAVVLLSKGHIPSSVGATAQRYSQAGQVGRHSSEAASRLVGEVERTVPAPHRLTKSRPSSTCQNKVAGTQRSIKSTDGRLARTLGKEVRDIATRNASKSAQPSNVPQKAEKPADVDDALTAARKEYLARGRNKLRDVVLPAMEMVVNCIPSGRQRNKATEANILLMQLLDEIQA